MFTKRFEDVFSDDEIVVDVTHGVKGIDLERSDSRSEELA
jgi:hypothetical protein